MVATAAVIVWMALAIVVKDGLAMRVLARPAFPIVLVAHALVGEFVRMVHVSVLLVGLESDVSVSVVPGIISLVVSALVTVNVRKGSVVAIVVMGE